MRSHQRYFSIERPDGGLLNAFVAVNNTAVRDESVVVAGHERVLRARLADARFFWDEDRKRPLIDRVHDLSGIIFLAKLAEPTMRDKADRIEALGRKLAKAFGAGPLKVDRAAELCKADLTTLMVQEFPDLQGVMGRYYALHAEEDAAIADAVAEHYLPKGADSELPVGAEGAVLAVADRLDTLAAGFACGLKPTGSKDAYGLRRAALGVLRILRGRGLRLPISQLVGWAANRVPETPIQELTEFILDRLRHHLVAEGARGDVADAVLATGLDEAIEVSDRVLALSPLVGQEDLQPLFAGLKRVRNIVRKQAPASDSRVNPDLFEQDAERELHVAITQARVTLEADLESGRIPIDSLVGMNAPITRFFDDVLVVHDDPTIRANRLALCRDCADLFGKLADFSSIQV
jgi:glycyl-tRNA synthetase beta chain